MQKPNRQNKERIKKIVINVEEESVAEEEVITK